MFDEAVKVNKREVKISLSQKSITGSLNIILVAVKSWGNKPVE